MRENFDCVALTVGDEWTESRVGRQECLSKRLRCILWLRNPKTWLTFDLGTKNDKKTKFNLPHPYLNNSLL